MTGGAAALGNPPPPGRHERRGRHEAPVVVVEFPRRLTELERRRITEMLRESFDERQRA